MSGRNISTDPELIHIQVVYAQIDQQRVYDLALPRGTSIEQAITASGILREVGAIDLAVNAVGVFGKLKPLTCVLNDGDRIEIYRQLEIDPKALRRLLAKRRGRAKRAPG